MKIAYSCVTCGRTLEAEGVLYECPHCSAESARTDGHPQGYPRGYLSVVFPPRQGVRPGAPRGAARRGATVDPHAMLPVPLSRGASFPAGATPLVEPERLRAATGFPRLSLKNDTLHMSGSLKDRASILVAAQALAAGENRVALASTGNAGASMACVGAAYGLSVVLFVPGTAPRAKLLQSLLFGARVVPVQGTYDDAFSLSIEYTRRCGGINRNTAYNPFTVEGKKTVSLEVFNQLGCRAPDIMYVPTGDGVIFSGACKGFADLAAQGSIAKLPVMIAVQAQGSNALHRSWQEGREVVLAGTSTIADSLSVSRPAAGVMALQFLKRTNGRTVVVTDPEISAAQAQLAQEAGLFVEPSSAAAWAGFLKESKSLDPGATVVVLLTGTGFKDTAAAEKLVTMPAPCRPDIESALRLLSDVYGMPAPDPP
jgi:threonine synthase